MAEQNTEELTNLLVPPINEQGEVELVQYEPGQIPPYWQEIVKRYGIRVFQYAMTFGLIIPEYTMRDYIEYAIENPAGYETIDLWGCQGSKKSNRSMQISYWAYGDWDTVLSEMVLIPDSKDLPQYRERGFVQKMQSIRKGECSPLLVWDDLTVGLPSSTYKTDIEIYSAIDSAWAAIRTKVKVMVLNNPLIDRLGRNIKDNITMEVFIGRNQVEQIERFVRLPGLKQLESNFFKVQVEPMHLFDWKFVPTKVFKEYHELRLELADYAIHKMGKAFKDEAVILEDMVPSLDAMERAGVAPASFTSMLKKGTLPSEKINGKVYVKKTDLDRFIGLIEKGKKPKTLATC